MMKNWCQILALPLIFSACTGEKGDALLSGAEYAKLRLFEIRDSSSTGIRFENRLTETPAHNSVNDPYFYNGSGLSVADFNNDGLQDIYFVSAQEANALYLNQGKLNFIEVSAVAGVADSVGFQTGVTAVDINSDGWTDLYLSVSGIHAEAEKRRNRLYINRGTDENGIPHFSEEAGSYMLDIDMYSTQAAFFDYDLDGDLDMALANHHQVDYPFTELGSLLQAESELTGERLYQNRGGKFHDVSGEAGLINNAIRCILGIAVSDVNNDGWPDFYVSNDFGGKDELYLNMGDGTFTPRVHQSFDHISYASMGNDLADYNNDGWTDLYTLDMTAEDNFSIKASMGSMNELLFATLTELGQHQQYMYNTLQQNNGITGAEKIPDFSDVAQISGISSTDWSWAPLVFDMDNDGRKDLYVANGILGDLINVDYLSYRNRMFVDYKDGKIEESEYFTGILEQMPERKKSDYFFWNKGELEFEKMNGRWTEELLTCSNGTAYADLDNDGDLDIVVNNSGGRSIIYENRSRQFNTGNYLQFELSGPENNPLGIGTRIIIKEAHGEQMLEQYLSRGFQSSISPVLHFGLGNRKSVEEVLVIWPGGLSQRLTRIKTNQLVQLSHADARETYSYRRNRSGSFTDITGDMKLAHSHVENDFNDYERESLLPHRMSTLGPALAAGDVNGDGMDDIYLGGAIGSAGKLFIQSRDGFTEADPSPWTEDVMKEDMNATFFDADGDGDKDLYVVSGGNEYGQGSVHLQDRLYLNDGAGRFSLTQGALPAMTGSGSVVVAGDYDGDGDQDLFVGGRQYPGRYPVPVSSHLLRNDSERGLVQFADVSTALFPDLEEIGMVTDAIWLDLNSSGRPDLVITGEWMSVKVFRNESTGFTDITQESGLADDVGWWNCIAPGDFDGDGDTDLVAGNLGLNYKYKASAGKPFEVYARDFDNNGTFDIVLGYYDRENLVPVRGRTCSSNQLPFIKQKFPTYNEFGAATLADVYGRENLSAALNYKATNFASSYFENRGDGTFILHPLARQAQISSVNSIIAEDMDSDGNLDLLLAGNLYGSEAETPRNDAGIGLFMRGDGLGGFKPVPATESGLYMGGDVKGTALLRLGRDGSRAIISAKNSGKAQLFKVN